MGGVFFQWPRHLPSLLSKMCAITIAFCRARSSCVFALNIFVDCSFCRVAHSKPTVFGPSNCFVKRHRAGVLSLLTHPLNGGLCREAGPCKLSRFFLARNARFSA